jgi:hypothetical protein
MASKPTNTETRTVRFFEIIDHTTSMPLKAELDWATALTALGAESDPVKRTVNVGGADHHGGAWQMSKHPSMLLLSRIRDDFNLPELIDRKTGDLDSLHILESQGIAETSHIAFFPSNIVGMIRTTTTPGAGNFEQWLNKMGVFGNPDPFAVVPLSRVSPQQRIAEIEEARGVKVRMRSTMGHAIAGRAPRLSRVVDALHEEFGAVQVEMRVYLPRGASRGAEEEAIMTEASGLISLNADGSDAIESARLSYISTETEKMEEFNILSDKLADKVEVQVVDGDGRSTRRASAAKAMQQAYNRLETELQAAVHRDRT